MIAFVRTFLFLTSFAFFVSAIIRIDPRCSQAETTALQLALDEARAAAQSAVNALRTQRLSNNADAFNGAFDPLFERNAITSVNATLSRLLELYSDQSYTVVIYTQTGMDQVLTRIPAAGAVPEHYEDGNFTNSGIGARSGRPGYRPGFVGYPDGDHVAATLIGYNPNPPFYRYSSESHIYMTERALNRGNTFDTRSLTEIRMRGLDPGFTQLDSISSPSTVLLHELVHVAGGLVDPTSRLPGARIRDGPHANPIYGWNRCVVIRRDFALFGILTQEVADCIMKFAVACYLQIANNNSAPTCWNTGNVNPDTLQPGPPGSGWMKRSMEVLEARARWHARSFR